MVVVRSETSTGYLMCYFLKNILITLLSTFGFFNNSVNSVDALKNSK